MHMHHAIKRKTSFPNEPLKRFLTFLFIPILFGMASTVSFAAKPKKNRKEQRMNQEQESVMARYEVGCGSFRC